MTGTDCAYGHLLVLSHGGEAYWFYETHASDITREDTKMMKRSGKKNRKKKVPECKLCYAS